MNEKQNWQWLPQWAPTFAVVVALLAAVVPASFLLGGELARLGGEIRRLDEGVAELKAGQARLEARLEARMESLFAELRAELREDRAGVADLSERVAIVEARQLANPAPASAPWQARSGGTPSVTGESP